VKLLVTGACGFVGSSLIRRWREADASHQFLGLDNLSRPGSETNRAALAKLGVELVHGDIRSASDLNSLPAVDFVIDAAALPSVRSGIDGRSSSRQVVEHNLLGTVNLLEYCRRARAGMVLISTSRVYAIAPLQQLPLVAHDAALTPQPGAELPPGVSDHGIDETFSTRPPLSMYGASKRTSELLILEYGHAFDLPVWINRCGVMAGAGQFGRAEQGVFSYWVHAWRAGQPLAYHGYGGAGAQVRDMLDPVDLVPLLDAQMAGASPDAPRVLNASGGRDNAVSLAQWSAWCADRFGPRELGTQADTHTYDLPWIVLDSRLAQRHFGWSPARRPAQIFDTIAAFAEARPDWLDLC